MLETKYLYFYVDFFCIIFPLLFSFHPRIQFYKQWKSFWFANISVALLFIIWDMLFTKMGVWWFNNTYLLDINVINLPIEEIMFFVCIPYACTFTYYCVKKLFPAAHLNDRSTLLVSYILLLINILFLIKYYNRWYTALTCSLISIVFIYNIIYKPPFLKIFYTTYVFILVPFLVSNGILTGSFTLNPVVNYNPDENCGIRIFTIPIEDSMYGMLLLYLNAFVFEKK